MRRFFLTLATIDGWYFCTEISKLRMNYQPYPKSRKGYEFKQKYAYCHSPSYVYSAVKGQRICLQTSDWVYNIYIIWAGGHCPQPLCPLS